MIDIKLPEISENIKSGQVIKIFVKAGDHVKKGQDILELETDKASLPIPSPADGVIKDILVKEGADAEVGSVIMRLEAGVTQEKAAPSAPLPSSARKEEAAPAAVSVQHQMPVSPAQGSGEEVVVIGGGPGGYAAAFYAADLGMDVTLVNMDPNPGGVCLYRGCIPSKALLHVARVVSEAREAEHFGISFSKPTIDVTKLREWKDKVVSNLTGGVGQLSKLRKIKYIQGKAAFLNSNTLHIEKTDGTRSQLTFSNAILATGSRPITLPNLPASKRILDSTSALDIETIPRSLLLIGGGYIGLELGTVYATLGTAVTVVEMLPQIMTGADRDLASVLEKRLATLMKAILVNTKVTKMQETSSGMSVTFEDKDGKSSTQGFEKVLVAVGRRPNTENLGLEKTRVTIDQRGFIQVNPARQTDDPAIYAIGDITGSPMLAHKASHEGRVAVEAIAGHKAAFEPKAIPCVVYTDPEIAWCGITETEARAKNMQIAVEKFPWAASGRALTHDRTDGLTKLILEPETGRILGVGIAGPGAGELIAEGVLAIEMGAFAEDLKLTIHPHPTLSETIMETAESFFGHSTHIYRPKKR